MQLPRRLIGRMGGDEFAIVTKGVGRGQVRFAKTGT
jgi:GGDEF domain-containing protein